MSEEFKPFEIEHCPECGWQGSRDCEPIDTREGDQEIRHWCEVCEWEETHIFELVHKGKKD